MPIRYRYMDTHVHTLRKSRKDISENMRYIVHIFYMRLYIFRDIRSFRNFWYCIHVYMYTCINMYVNATLIKTLLCILYYCVKRTKIMRRTVYKTLVKEYSIRGISLHYVYITANIFRP